MGLAVELSDKTIPLKCISTTTKGVKESIFGLGHGMISQLKVPEDVQINVMTYCHLIRDVRTDSLDDLPFSEFSKVSFTHDKAPTTCW